MSGTRSKGSHSSSTSSSVSAASADGLRARRRRRALLAVGALAVAAVVLALALRGGDGDPLARAAPPDALGWVHVRTGADWAVGGRFAALRAAPERLAGAFGLRASELDLARDVRSWIGADAGVAWLPSGAPLLLASVGDRAAAAAALRRLGARLQAGGLYALPAPGAAAGIAHGVLAAGPQAAVRAALARAAGGAPGLSATPAYRHAMRGRSGDAPLAVFATAAGVRRLAGSARLLPRVAGALLDGPQLDGVAAEAEPADGGVRVHARLLRRPGAAAPAGLASGLLGRVPARGTVALVDLAGGSALGAFVARLGGAGALAAAQSAVADGVGVDLERDVLAPLRGEAVLSLQARGDVPLFTLVARSAGPATTREALARLQAPVARRLTGDALTMFQSRDDGTFTLPITPRLQPSYGVAGDVLVATSAQPGLDQMRAAPRGIAQVPVFAKALEAAAAAVQALGFIDVQALLRLGERTGLAAGATLAEVRAELDPIESAGAVAGQDPDHPTDTTAELFLQIP